MTYTYTNVQNTLITDGSRFIPVDPSNTDYQKLVQSNVAIAPYMAPPAPIRDLTVLQFLSALVLGEFITEAEARNRTNLPTTLEAGLNAYLSAIEDAEERQRTEKVARVTWANMTMVPRNEPLVDALGALLNQTPEQIDAFFRQAANI